MTKWTGVSLPDVRKIDNHANAIHLVNQFPSVGANAAPNWGCLFERIALQSGIRILVMAVVCQRCVPHTKIAEEAQVARLVGDLVQTLHTQGRNQLSPSKGLEGPGAVNVMGKVLGVSCEEPLHGIDCLQRELKTCRQKEVSITCARTRQIVNETLLAA
jgi:hypothetical protein